MSELYPLLFKNLEDPIPLLRQGAASALANIVNAYGTAALPLILDKIVTGLEGTEKMKDTSTTEAIAEAADKLEISENTCVLHDRHCQFAVPGKVQITSAALFNALNPSGELSPTHLNPNSPVTSCLNCRKSKIPQPWHLSDG